MLEHKTTLKYQNYTFKSPPVKKYKIKYGRMMKYL